ncbi:MAG TPA: NAD(P)/FAD-dependent oxidoreductase, partial [Myxococcota bacterium]
MNEPPEHRDRYCIVGSGPSGVCAARWLGELGVPFDVLERQRDVGGIWDISAPGSPMYESCHFISSKTLSGFHSDPMPSDYPDYPRHGLVLDYLKNYADRHGLRQHIEFGVSVEHAMPTADAWRVTLGSGETRSYAGVIASVGNEWRASRPDIPGRFEGSVIHSSEYESPESLTGKRVLVVGGGNSGCDLAADAATHARSAAISLRRGYHFVPKYILGQPTDVFAAGSAMLPAWIKQPMFEMLLR